MSCVTGCAVDMVTSSRGRFMTGSWGSGGKSGDSAAAGVCVCARVVIPAVLCVFRRQ